MKPIVSYAQNLEDVMILRALCDVEEGFYIDVGAHDPIEDSVTKALYERGWHGINIEPVPHWHRKLEADRPRDINLELALGSGPGRIRLIEFPGTGLSTTHSEIADQHRAAGFEAMEREVEVDTLDAVCERYGTGTVHLLKIDVEGAEKEVLSGADFVGMRPWLVVVEATMPMSQEQNHETWQELLTSKDYIEVYFDGLNRFYLAKEQAHRADRFAYPPNVFDRYTRYTEKMATERLAELEKENAEISEGLRQAERERQDLETDCAKLARSNLHLAERNETLGAEIRSAQARIADLENKLLNAREETLQGMEEWRSILREQQEIKTNRDAIAAALVSMRAEVRGLRDGMRENKDARARISFLEAENAALNGYIVSLRTSTSWRLTAPLRGLKTAVMSIGATRGTRAPTDAGARRARVARLARWAAQKPALRRIAFRAIALHPGIEVRLRGLMTASTISPASPSGFAMPDAAAFAATSIPIAQDIDASATERRVLAALHRASRIG